MQALFDFVQDIQLSLTADQGVDPCCVNAGMPQQVGKADDVFFHLVIVHCKEVTQVVREDFFPAYIGNGAESFHTMQDVAAVNGFAAPGHKNAAGCDLPFTAVLPQVSAELCGNEDFPGFSLQGNKSPAGADRRNCDKRQLTDPDAG